MPLIIVTHDVTDDGYRTAIQALRDELFAGRDVVMVTGRDLGVEGILESFTPRPSWAEARRRAERYLEEHGTLEDLDGEIIDVVLEAAGIRP